MSTTVPRAVPVLASRRRPGWVRRALVWLRHAAGFVAQTVDELVTAWLGVAPVLPRLRRWHQHLVAEWRVYRAVTEGSVMEGDVIEGGLRDGVWH